MDMDSPPTLLSCDSCGNLAVGSGTVTCCAATMTEPEPVDAVADPTLEALLRDVFQMSDAELDVCLCVMEGGTMTVTELATEVVYDRSVVSPVANPRHWVLSRNSGGSSNRVVTSISIGPSPRRPSASD